MGTTVASLRTTYLNSILGRSEAASEPWTDAECTTALETALQDMWPRVGILATGDIATAQVNEYSLPAGIGTVDGNAVIARIDLLGADGTYLDQIVNFRRIPGGKIVVKPQVIAGYTMRITGWKPFATDASDLVECFYNPICWLAASALFGMLGGKLANYQRQQGLDPARVVSQQDAIGMSAYYMRLWQQEISDSPYTVTGGVRRAYR